MADEPAPRPGVLGSLRTRAEGWLRQLLAPIGLSVWGGGGGWPVAPQYPPLRSMAALVGSAWVRACVRAKTDDIGGLPLVAVRGRGQTEQLDDHPFLAVMRRPSPGVTETMLRRQWVADFVLTGNMYAWLRRTQFGWEVHRLHPAHCEGIVRDGVVVGWQVGDRRLSVREVYHTHDVCWTDDLTAMYGESAIRTLHDGLTGVRASRRHVTTAADRGRPDVILTLEGTSPGDKAVSAVGEAYEENARQGRRAFVVSKGVQVQQVAWSPKDMEYGELDTRVRDETLAVMRVPPTRAGVPQANYAVAKAELRDYWSSLVSAELKLFGDLYTAMAHEIGGELDVQIMHDTSAVEALQTSYDQRQARAGFWVQVMGATPAAAAAYEGFRDAPVGTVAGTQPASRPAKEVDDQPNRQALVERTLTAWLRQAATRLEGGGAEVNEESLRLLSVLELGGAGPEAVEMAREVAEIVCAVANEGHPDLADLYPFSSAYARRVATRPRLSLAAK